MQDNIILSRSEYEILLKDSIDLSMLSNDYKHLKRRNKTLEEHIEDLRNDTKFYIELYKYADARANQLQRNLDERETEDLTNG
ncbi:MULTISPECIES: hypothetical protein [Bacilli]|uniref:hypothetical protein n=1 Tax=Bacilli TaxID=91061 RepID=UPI00066B6DAA|nr:MULTISPECIES: hypothetical protein [Bacilli]MBE9438572.1 hypothetical protein [Enterococcus faecalis]MCH4447337.1 hypothetical protein [Staphylococcus haemolyticus]MCK6069090.1 hypothetical protein [Staphylococcus haemolyticus]MCK6111087.1 hypothetical protein [Staphylococcus haemolyticus]MCK6168596.1 hypothetical protein [Staphylococcus haemolyticus]